jgi:hypothetical protein
MRFLRETDFRRKLEVTDAPPATKMSQILSLVTSMKIIGILALLFFAPDRADAKDISLPRPQPAGRTVGDVMAAAKDIPLPRPRPAGRSVGDVQAQLESAPPMLSSGNVAPSACRLRLTSELAIAPSVPAMAGPGECGGPDLVRLEAVILRDNKGKVALNPPAMVRCSMAEAIVHWIRDDLAPAAATLGSPLKSLDGSSYECRSRNHIAGAKLSEHGRANAFDLLRVKLANGKAIDPTDRTAPTEFRTSMRQSACARFTTVLGPGADRSHENHVHVDLAERRRGYRMCQWDVREPAPAQVAELVPLPPPRPNIENEGAGARNKRGVNERIAMP